MKKITVFIIFVMMSFCVLAQDGIPSVSSGSIKRFFIESAFVDSRNVDIWLPENYNHSKKYAVLYMHDGQQLFDNKTWNGQEWKVDETIDSLLKVNEIQDVIVVGILNNGNKRYPEYFPEKVIYNLPDSLKKGILSFMNETPLGDNYLKFIVKEVKPLIDKTFSTFTGKEHTFICGSSMGGLISMYALCEYPEVFGGAICMSTHWIGILDYNTEIPDAFVNYLKVSLPPPSSHKIYFDCGTEGLDVNYPICQSKIDEVMQLKGYHSKLWQTRHFEGANHSEKYWAERLHIPLKFMLEK